MTAARSIAVMATDMRVDIDLDRPAPPATPARSAGPCPRRAVGAIGAIGILAVALTALAVVALTAVGVASHAPTASAPMGSFAGEVAEGRYLIVVVASTGAAVAFACDRAGGSTWLTGRAEGDILLLHDGASAAGTLGPLTTLTLAPAGPLRTPGAPALGGMWRMDGDGSPVTLSRTGAGAGLFAAESTVDGVPHRIVWVALDAARRCGVLAVGDSTRPAPEMDARHEPARVDRLTPKWGTLSAALVRLAHAS
jgi:hypothetical protein